METKRLKDYAPKARKAFIQAVTDRAAFFGLTAKKTEPITEQGDVAIIGGKAFPRSVADKRRRLEERVERHGFAQTLEAVAYTWFNRLVAIRYMELHGYLDHGYRVLSNPDADTTTPEILQHAEHVNLPGLKSDEVIELKLDGSKESELYRKLLIAQCNALHEAMPFLFERIDDETELLLPDSLLHSDSIVRTLVTAIDEDDWQQVEIIGWLYQFYIAEKKDQVIGKVVKSEDIPAATQLFTPNWIVKYLVQNSLGRQWVATYPNSPLKAKMEYYIEPAEQMTEVQAQLDAITPTSLNPEELTLLDPACGSGHILVEAYDLLKEIYLERGYRLRDIPGLILAKNLFGLEIDDRAAQLAAFALMMKARADDRGIFDGHHQPNVISIQESNGLDINGIIQAFTAKTVTDATFAPPGEFAFMTSIKAPLLATIQKPKSAGDDQVAADLNALLHLFENAKTYGSLITIPKELAECLPALAGAAEKAMTSKDLAIQQAGRVASIFISQGILLAKQYDAVVANPPYMGGKGQNAALNKFAKDNYPDSNSDLFAMFLERGFELAKSITGHNAMVTMQSWMFLSCYEKMRKRFLTSHCLETMLHMGNGVMRIAFGTSAICFRCGYYGDVTGSFSYCTSHDLNDRGIPAEFPVPNERLKTCRQSNFHKIPGNPIAYWYHEATFELFASSSLLGVEAAVKTGMSTGCNARFVRMWHEVALPGIGLGMPNAEAAMDSGKKWFPYNKGGGFRKWYGFNEHVVDWEFNGRRIKESTGPDGKRKASVRAEDYYFRPSVSYSAVTNGSFSARMSDKGFLFDSGGSSVFQTSHIDLYTITGLLCSSLPDFFLSALNDTINFQPGDIGRIPVAVPELIGNTRIRELAKSCVGLERWDWDAYEVSWDFASSPIVGQKVSALADAYAALQHRCEVETARMKELEEENNRLFLEAYNLQDELSPQVPAEQITLFSNPAYRYPPKRQRSEETARPRPPEELEGLFREDTAKELISYAVGCMMGRYSLDEPGVIYAYANGEGLDISRYKTFPPDGDGIVPVTEIDWFSDDAGHRLEQFVGTAWPKQSLEANLKWLSESLGTKNGEDARTMLWRYMANGFYKHHLKTYKNRPIYWLFSSGKLGAFQCLVYLHRYNEGTLARMRTEYVIPLQGKMPARIEQLEGDKAKATSASHRSKIQKEQDTLRKQQDELRGFDEKLRHYADQRISLELDDGVKVNYGKFGDLLAEVTAVCGKMEGEA